MRITQTMMYSSFTSNINSNLSDYMDLNLQSATMKKVNAPSDDPAASAHILNYRASIEKTEQYVANIDTGIGWLDLSSGVLSEVNTTLSRFKELAEQGATGTYDDENRLQIAAEARELYERLITLANSEQNGRFIFAGQNIDAAPYEESLGVSTVDPNFDGVIFPVEGEAPRSILIRFDSTTPPAADPADITLPPPAGTTLNYSYTDDGGETWQTGVVAGGDTVMRVADTEIGIVDIVPPRTVELYDPALPFSEDNGTSLTIRPAAEYLAYDNSVPPEVTTYGESPAGVTLTGNGYFETNVQVRLNDNVDLTDTPQSVSYSYSTDGGQSWITQTVESRIDINSGEALVRLPVPGGFFDLEGDQTDPNNIVSAGTQYSIQPQRANLDYEQAQDSYITVNNVGKDVFGGVYVPQGTDVTVAAFDGEGENLFETLGRLVGALETNNQEGCSRALEEIEEALTHLLTEQASIGARTTHLESTRQMLTYTELDLTERMSYLEDVDVTELVNDLTMQQMAYQTVLQSSSMIMNLNLTNFL